MLLVIRYVIYFLSAVLTVAFFVTLYLGREIHNAKKHDKEDILNEPAHIILGRACFWIALMIAMSVEGMLTIRYGFHMRPHIPGFLGHLWGGVVPFVILVPTCVFWVDGKRFPRLHRWLVYPCFISALSMASTGDILVHNLH